MLGNKEALSVELVNDHYIRTDGLIASNEGWFYTTPIAVKAGQSIEFTAYAGAANAAISKYENSSYIMLVKGAGSTKYQKYTYIANSDMEVVFSAKRGANEPIATIDGENITFNGY